MLISFYPKISSMLKKLFWAINTEIFILQTEQVVTLKDTINLHISKITMITNTHKHFIFFYSKREINTFWRLYFYSIYHFSFRYFLYLFMCDNLYVMLIHNKSCILHIAELRQCVPKLIVSVVKRHSFSSRYSLMQRHILIKNRTCKLLHKKDKT